jgi:hypothetical protein
MSAYHCLVCSLPLDRKGKVWACTATASHDYHRPLTLAEEMADLRAELTHVTDAASALLDNLETLCEPHPLDFAVRGIDVERLRAALEGRRAER